MSDTPANHDSTSDADRDPFEALLDAVDAGVSVEDLAARTASDPGLDSIADAAAAASAADLADAARYHAAHTLLASDDAPEVPTGLVTQLRSIFDAAAMAAASRSAAPAWLAAIDRLTAMLAFDSRLHAAGVRYAGADDRFQATWTAGDSDDVEVDLQGERQDGRWRLMGQLGSDRPIPPGGSRLLAHRDDVDPDRASAGDLVEAESDATGIFELDLPPGRWTLILETTRDAVVLEGIDLPAE